MAFDIIPPVRRAEPIPGGAPEPMEPPAQPWPRAERPIGEAEIKAAAETLRKYKAARARLEDRVVRDELWWELRHWEAVDPKGGGTPPIRPSDGIALPPPYTVPPPRTAAPLRRLDPARPRSASAWLFNAIASKHADAMDNYPEPAALPRERGDEASARVLSQVLPVVLEANGFEDTYAAAWWEKLKHGTAIYGVFWDAQKQGGLGDIDIRQIDLLNLFWEPGISDLQESRNLFLCELEDRDLLEEQYPVLRGKGGSERTVEIAKYLYDDTVDTTDKAVVVDWYYKRGSGARAVLHYAKFVGDTLLYASENDPALRGRGWYDHGLYPFFADVLFPEKGTPVGFGYVAICKDPQMYIDKLYSNVLETSMQGTRRRYFVSDSADVNEGELLDWNNPLVRVSGPLDDARLREIVTRPLDSVYLNVLQLKIDELKETASNRDVTNGGTASGATAAAAIAALQEAGNKMSRDMISASYRCYRNVVRMCVELMRQFYTTARVFRVTNELPYEYAQLGADQLAPQTTGIDAAGQLLIREPVFDIKIAAQKRNPFSQAAQNERAKELYSMGFFAPDRAQESLLALDMMQFEGIDKIRQSVSEGNTLLKICQQLAQELQTLRAALGMVPAASGGAGGSGAMGAPAAAISGGAPGSIGPTAGASGSGGSGSGSAPGGGGEGQEARAARAAQPGGVAAGTSYGQRLVEQQRDLAP